MSDKSKDSRLKDRTGKCHQCSSTKNIFIVYDGGPEICPKCRQKEIDRPFQTFWPQKTEEDYEES
jgi:hypothetical protein